MSAPTEYWVSPLLGSWDVRRGDIVLSHHASKRHAVQAAVDSARANRPSVVKIQRRDSTVESTRHYHSAC